MIYSIECFLEIQEEHSTGTLIIHLAIDISQEADKTSARGVSLPESRLAVRDNVVIR